MFICFICVRMFIILTHIQANWNTDPSLHLHHICWNVGGKSVILPSQENQSPVKYGNVLCYIAIFYRTLKQHTTEILLNLKHMIDYLRQNALKFL